MNGIIYCRVSSKEQIEGTSLESQELACRECARSKQVKVLKVFIGRGESAKFADRPELLEVLEFCRKNKGSVQLLFIWKIDRLARNVSDFFNIKALLLKYGVRVVSVTEPIDSNPEGKLLETILAGFAQFDNDIRAMRTVQGMKRKLQEGIFPWRPPLGYKVITENGEKKTEPDRPFEPTFSLLRKSWHEFATGAYTKAEIRKLMATWGVLARNGKPLPAQSVDNLFRNKYYAGILVDPWSGEEHEGKHLALVSRETFAKVQEIVSHRNRSKPHQKFRPEFPLRGLVRCPMCKKYLTAGFSRGRSKKYGYYSCANKRCNKRLNYAAGDIHSEFEAFLDAVKVRQQVMVVLEETIVEKAVEQQAITRAQWARKKSEIRRLNHELQQLIQMRAKELLTDEEFREQKALVAERRSAQEASLSGHSLDLANLRNNLRQITAPLANLADTWKRADPALHQRFKRMLLPVGFPAGQIRTAELGRLFYLSSQSSTPNSIKGCLTGEILNQIIEEIQDLAELFRDNDTNKIAA